MDNSTGKMDNKGDNSNRQELSQYDAERVSNDTADLLLRHRAPPLSMLSMHSHSTLTTDQQEQQPSSMYQQSIDRIRIDSAGHVRHPVPTVHSIDNEDDDDDYTEPGNLLLFWWRGWTRTLGLRRRRPDGISQPWSQYSNYSMEIFRKDCVAGATVAIMAVPLSMSYAKLAGLPAHYGLYASFLPPIVYPFFGTCRQLSVGPAALVSLLLVNGLTTIVTKELGSVDSTGAMATSTSIDLEQYTDRYTQLAIQCAFLAGLIQIMMGIVRMGFVTQFLSRALISGFTSGASVIIAISQFKHFLGVDFPTSKRSYELLHDLIRLSDEWNWRTFTMGSASLALLLLLKAVSQPTRSWSERYPNIKWLRPMGPFLVTLVSILLTYTLDLDTRGIRVVGPIPPGLPKGTIDQFTPVSSDLLAIVISMVVVSFVQSIAISKRFAYKHGYEIDPSQELIGLGIANLVGAAFQASPTTGAIGQSAVNDEIGAVTGVASLVTGVLVMVVLLFLTPVFEKMPLSVLAAIVMAFVTGMFDYTEAIYLFKVHKFDFGVWMAAFLGTVILGVEYGLIISVAVSLLIVLYESVYPHTAVLGRLPGTSLYRNIKQYPNAERYDGLVIVRVDAPLYFANAQNARDKVRKYKRMAEEDLSRRNAGTVQYIILDLSPVSHIDTTAVHVLQDMHATQKKIGVQICFCNPNITVTMRLLKSGLIDLVGRDHFFSDVIDAVQFCLNNMDRRSDGVSSPSQGSQDA